MRDKLSLNLYLKKDKGPDYNLLSALYFLDIENSLPLFNTGQLYSAQDLLLDPGLFKLSDSETNAMNLKNRRLEYSFYNESTNIFLLLDVSPSNLKYNGTTSTVQLEDLEKLVMNLIESSYKALTKLRTENQLIIRPKLNVFAFGFPKSDFLNLLTDFDMEEDTLSSLKEKMNTIFQLLEQKIHSELLQASKTHRKGMCFTFDKFFVQFMNYFSRSFTSSNLFSKLLLFTDGISFDNLGPIFESLQMNKLYMSCDILFTTHPDNCISNDFGFIAAKSSLKSVAKLLNGSLYTYEQLTEILERQDCILNNSKPLVPDTLKIFLAITQNIKYIPESPQEEINGKSHDKPLHIKPFEKIRKEYQEGSSVSIKNIYDFLQQKILSSWKICHIHRQDSFEKEITLRLKFAPKVDLLASLSFKASPTQEIYLKTVTHSIIGPQYFVNSILEESSKANKSQIRFKEMLQCPIDDKTLFAVLPKTISLKYDRDSHRCDLAFSEYALRVFSLINKSKAWHKYFTTDRLIFAFKKDFDGQTRKWVLRQKVEDLLVQFTDKALSKSLYLKVLVAPENNQTNEKLPVDKFCLIKYRWLTKQILSFKLGLYSKKSESNEGFMKEQISDRITQQIIALEGFKVSNSIINVFVFNAQQTLCINPKFATVREDWEQCACLKEFLPFFLNLNHHLTNNAFTCIFSSRTHPQLIYVTRLKLQVITNKTTGEKTARDKEIFYQIVHHEKEKVMRCTLFTDPFDAIFDFESDGKVYQKSNLKTLIRLLKNQIELIVKTTMSKILTVHHIHFKSLESKLSQNKKIDITVMELNQKYYKRKNIQYGHEEDEAQITQTIRHSWTGIIYKDYHDFMIERHKDCVDFENIFQHATRTGSIELNLLRLKDRENASPETIQIHQDAVEELLNDFHRDIKNTCDFEYISNSRTQVNFGLHAKFLVNKKLLMIIAPKTALHLPPNKKPEAVFYLLDVDSVEYPPELQQFVVHDHRIDTELHKMIQSACKEVKDRLLDDFKKSFSRNVYKVCIQGLRLSDEDINDAIEYCSKERHVEVNMTEFFQPFITSELKSTTDLTASPNLSPALENDLIEKTIISESRHLSDDENELKRFKIYENLIDNIIKVFFIKVDANIYVEHPQQFPVVVDKLLAEKINTDHSQSNSTDAPPYLHDFFVFPRKMTLDGKINPKKLSKRDPKFLFIKVFVFLEGRDTQQIIYDGFINTCRKVLDLIQNQRNAKVKMKLNLIWEPSENREETKSPVPYYSIMTSPHENLELSRTRLDSPMSPNSTSFLTDICDSLEKFMNTLTVDTIRFVRPITSEGLNCVFRTFNFIVKRSVEIHVEWLDENTEPILASELLKMPDLTLKKRDKWFYYFQKKTEIDSPHKESLTSLPGDETVEIPYWFLLYIDREAQKIRGNLHLPPYKTELNYKTLVGKYNKILTETVNKVQKLIMMNELRTTLYCPNHLKLGDERYIRRSLGEEVTKKSSSGIGGIRKSMMRPIKRNNNSMKFRSGSPFQSKVEEGTSILKESSNEKSFEIPLIHQELFPVYERIRKGEISFGNYSFFRNFQISNIENAYLAFNDKEIYILVINEVDNPFYQTDVKRSVNKSPFEDLTNLVTTEDMIKKPSLTKSKTILVLRIYSMEAVKPHVINNFSVQINELLTLDSIRCFANAFVKSTQIRFTPADVEYLSDIDRKLTIRFELPSYIGDLEAFLNYFKQKARRFFYTYIISQPSHVRNNSYSKASASVIDEFEGLEFYLKSPKMLKHESLGILENYETFFDQSEFKLFYNCLRPVNDIQLHEYFGKCLFLLNLTLWRYYKDKDKDDQEGMYREIKKFDLHIPSPMHKEEPRIAVNLQGFSLQDEIENHFKTSDLCFVGVHSIIEDNGDAVNWSLENVDPDKLLLDCELLIKGKLNDDNIRVLLTELINHTFYDYFIENFFVNHHFLHFKVHSSVRKNALDEKIAPIYNMAYYLDKIHSLTRVPSSSIHQFSIPHTVLHNQLFEVFRNLAHIVENVILEKIGNNQITKIPFVYFLEQNDGNAEEYELRASQVKITKLKEVYEEMFKYPQAFLQKRLPRISGVFYGLDPETTTEGDQELPWVEKLKIYDSIPRNNNIVVPRSIFIQFYITVDEIGLLNYNCLEDIHFNIKTNFQALVDWSTKRFRIMQTIMNDRLALDLLSTSAQPEVKHSRRSTNNRREYGFLNELNKPSSAKTHQALDSRKWSEKMMYKSLGLHGMNFSQNNLAVESKMNFTKSLQYYASNLYIDQNQQKFLNPFDAIYQKIRDMHLRYACVKISPEDNTEDGLFGLRDYADDSFLLENFEFKISDLIKHHMERFMEAAKTCFKKSKNKARMRVLMKPRGIPDNYKKPFIRSFVSKSFILNEQKIPLFLITRPPLAHSDDSRMTKLKDITESHARHSREEALTENSIAFINEFSEKLMNEVLSHKCLNEYESFYMETTNPRAPGSLEALKTALSTSALDEFDSRKIINRPSSPAFGAMSISQKIKPKDDMENLNPLSFAFRRTSLNPDSSQHDLQKHFNDSARDSIEHLQQSQKLYCTSIYLRHVVGTVLFFFKLQISYPFMTLSLIWDSLTENKDKVTGIINREALTVVSNINLQSIVYDYHINLFKKIIRKKSTDVNNLELSLMFINFANYFTRPPDNSKSIFYGSDISINPGYLYIKFNPASVWQCLLQSYKKYGLGILSEKDSNTYMYVLEDFKDIPCFEKLESEQRPKVVFIMHNEESKNNNPPSKPENRFSLDQFYSKAEYLYISYFVLYDKEACGMKLAEITTEVEKIIIEMVRKLRRQFIAQVFLQKIIRNPENILSSDELQNLLSHSNSTSLKMYDKEVLEDLTELDIFNQRFIKYVEAAYGGSVKFFRENFSVLEAEDPNKAKEATISSILISNKSHSLTILIQMNNFSCIEDIYLMKTNDDPKRLTEEEQEFFKLFKKNILIYIWKYNLFHDYK